MQVRDLKTSENKDTCTDSLFIVLDEKQTDGVLEVKHHWQMTKGAIFPHALWPRGCFVHFFLLYQKGIRAVLSESSEPVTH